MPPTTIRMAIAACLQNLSKEDLEKFCHALIHRGGDPRVRRNKVEGKTILQITDTLVNTFTEPGALKVTLELLRNVDCSDDADELAAEASGGAANLPAHPTNAVDDMDSSEDPAVSFILTQKMKFISCLGADPLILQLAHQNQLITQSEYRKLKSISSVEDTVTDLIDMVMDKGPDHCRLFLQILKERDVVETYPLLKDMMKDWE